MSCVRFSLISNLLQSWALDAAHEQLDDSLSMFPVTNAVHLNGLGIEIFAILPKDFSRMVQTFRL